MLKKYNLLKYKILFLALIAVAPVVPVAANNPPKMLVMACSWLDQHNRPMNGEISTFGLFQSSQTGKMAVMWTNSDGTHSGIYNQTGNSEELQNGSIRENFKFEKATLQLIRSNSAASIHLELPTDAGLIPVNLSCDSLRFVDAD